MSEFGAGVASASLKQWPSPQFYMMASGGPGKDGRPRARLARHAVDGVRVVAVHQRGHVLGRGRQRGVHTLRPRGVRAAVLLQPLAEGNDVGVGGRGEVEVLGPAAAALAGEALQDPLLQRGAGVRGREGGRAR